jgi:Protein of unknown function (DUF992)
VKQVNRDQRGQAACVGVVVGSFRELACTFTPASGGQVEEYKGEINKFGADIGYS